MQPEHGISGTWRLFRLECRCSSDCLQGEDCLAAVYVCPPPGDFGPDEDSEGVSDGDEAAEHGFLPSAVHGPAGGMQQDPHVRILPPVDSVTTNLELGQEIWGALGGDTEESWEHPGTNVDPWADSAMWRGMPGLLEQGHAGLHPAARKSSGAYCALDVAVLQLHETPAPHVASCVLNLSCV